MVDLTGSVPEWIRALLPLCWAPLQDDRPTAADVCEVLSLEAFFVNLQNYQCLYTLFLHHCCFTGNLRLLRSPKVEACCRVIGTKMDFLKLNLTLGQICAKKLVS